MVTKQSLYPQYQYPQYQILELQGDHQVLILNLILMYL